MRECKVAVYGYCTLHLQQTCQNSNERYFLNRYIKAEQARCYEQLKQLGVACSPEQSPTDEEVLGLWLRTIEEYTALDLTFPSDYLPALCGYAAQWAEVLYCYYLCSHWEANLARSLAQHNLIHAMNSVPPRTESKKHASFIELSIDTYKNRAPKHKIFSASGN